MSFGTPAALLLLLLLPLAVIAYAVVQRRRSKYVVRFTNLDLLASVVEGTPGWRRHAPAAVYLLAVGLLFLAVARPHRQVSVPRDGTVVMVEDISGSMNATDISPTRLGAAQSASRTLMGELPGGFRVSLISFSNSVQVRVPPTTDRQEVSKALDALVPNGGTAMGDAIMTALDVIQQEFSTDIPTPTPVPGAATPGAAPTPAPISDSAHPKAVIVLMSDGASNTGSDPLQAASQAKDLGIPIFTIALGTPDGIAVVRDNAGRLRSIPVPPDPQTLQQIAQTTGGQSFDAPTSSQLQSIYKSLGSKIGTDTKTQDVSPLFVGLGIVAVVVAGGMSLFWFNRFP